jgi:hypothetical protein
MRQLRNIIGLRSVGLILGENMKVMFSTNKFEVYGIDDNTKYKITNEDPKIPITSLQDWQMYALRKNKTKGNKKKIIFIKISLYLRR